MNTICNLVLIILSMSVTGLVLTLIWIMLKALFGRFLRSDIIYKMLKIVIISYFIPFEFLVFSFKFHFLEGTENYFYFFSNPMKLVLGSVFAIMMVMIIVEVCRWIKGNIKLKKSTRLRMPVKVDVNNIVNELCADMKIKKKFSVYQGFATASPFIYGFIKPEIYLTVDKLSEEDLRIALTHELFHYKQGDVFFKPLVSIMCCINWFNPLAWFVKKEFNLWSEVCCDYKCFTKGGYDIEEYFDAILRMATGLYEKYLGIISMAAGKSQLYKRTMLMIKYSKNKLNYTILTVIMTVTVVISFLSLYGTSYAAEYMYNYVYESTQTEVLEYDIKTEDGYIEHVVKNVNSNINSEPAAVEAFAEIDYYNDVAYCTVEKVLKKNESYSEILSGLKGNNLICITINTEDKNSVFQLGIIEPDGTNRYIECNGMANHQFEVNRSGDYKLYITNIGEIDTEIIVSIMVAPK